MEEMTQVVEPQEKVQEKPKRYLNTRFDTAEYERWDANIRSQKQPKS
jgi:hypothetical protein